VKNLRAGTHYPGVCVVFICHDGMGRVLLHRRSAMCRDEHHLWDSGAGQLELHEGFEAAVRRGVKEKYCCQALRIDYASTANVLRKHEGVRSHWVAIVFAVLVDPTKVRIGEPDKMDALDWFLSQAFPEHLHSKFAQHYNSVKHLL